MTTTPAPFPVWTPAVRTVLGVFTPEQHAVLDSETVNRRAAMAAELHARAEAAEQEGRPTAAMLRRSAARADVSAERAQTNCTNSGMVRAECTTCDHSRQLELMAAAA